jgi:hypothetical protein
MTTLAAKLPDLMRGDDLILGGIIVASVVGIVAIVVPIVIYLRQRNVISVDYEIISDVKLMDSDAADATDAFANQIEVTYNGRHLTHPRIVDVRVTNTGNTPVEATDYEHPIVFELDGGQPPIDATVIAETAQRITGNLFESKPDPPRAISIRPPLLNRGEWFTLRMLFDNKDSRVIGSHRIVGGHPMRESVMAVASSQARFSRYGLALWTLAVIPSGIIGGIALKSLAQGILIAATVNLAVGVLLAIIAAFFAKSTPAPAKSSRR